MRCLNIFTCQDEFITLSPALLQFLNLMETIDKQRDEMGRSSRSVIIVP